jgi:Double zinc ribbon/Adenylate and Guanylate cyclase catalytic domain
MRGLNRRRPCERAGECRTQHVVGAGRLGVVAMWCPRCRHENPDGARFCLHCGAQLAVSCAGCGAVQPLGARFCPECGQAAATAPNPASYTPRHISDQILAVRGAIEGERKQVSVLFCDIVASSALAAELGPQEFHLVIDRFSRAALAEVHRYEGTINRFLGDGFMALFGAPIAHEDHARRAVLAALGIAAQSQVKVRDRRPTRQSFRGLRRGSPYSRRGCRSCTGSTTPRPTPG